MPNRRQFFIVAGAGFASAALARAVGAQQQQMPNMGAANVPMDEARYHPVRLPSRGGGTGPSMSDLQRDALEHRLHCQCGCTLDVFTCRTTDFSCQISPAMHKDVMALVAGGYSASEIINAFVGVYGERVLMEPEKRGFNLAGYLMPFVALGVGAALVVALLRRWHAPAAGEAPVASLPVEGTPDELKRLDSLVHRDDP
ncbi:MAG TPA: cytochrome c-type biogenesis protein CcmH [Gemmatimonadaceae bacterium]|jgi:cytochrome c-type biogenesis protein CcmH